MSMSNENIRTANPRSGTSRPRSGTSRPQGGTSRPQGGTSRPRGGTTSRAAFRDAEARGPIIDQEGREIPAESLGEQLHGFRFDFGGANPFGNLTREQRL